MHLEVRGNNPVTQIFIAADPGEQFRVELTDREISVSEIEILLLDAEKVSRIQEGDLSVQADVLRPDTQIPNKFNIPKGLGRVSFESARHSLVRVISEFEVVFDRNEST